MGAGKKLLAALGIGATVAGIAVLAIRAKEAPPVSVTLEIIPGRVIGRGIAALPGTLREGMTGNIARVTITNNSVYAGTTVKAPWMFPCLINIVYGPSNYRVAGGLLGGNFALAAGETKSFDVPFDLPYGYSGAGTARAALYARPGDTEELASTPTLNITVEAAPITPAGGLSW